MEEKSLALRYMQMWTSQVTSDVPTEAPGMQVKSLAAPGQLLSEGHGVTDSKWYLTEQGNCPAKPCPNS